MNLDAIAASLQAYDPNALRCQDVLAFLHRLVTPLTQTEELPLAEALDRVLAQDLVSGVAVPAHDNAAMDGYAFDGAVLPAATAANQELTLSVVGSALAGHQWDGALQSGQCVRITTGAVMPAGFDTVVPLELVQVRGETIVLPPGVVRQGEHRRLRGEDLALGSVALQRGERLTPARLGLAASLGLAQVRVLRRLRVAYFSTGDEILTQGEAPREGAVYDSNRYTVLGMLTRLGCEVQHGGVVADDPQALRAAFLQAARSADAVITSGGVSVGEADHTKAMMRQLGDVAFWRIAMRPGRPMAVGRITAHLPAGSADEGVPVFGLPGNPVAVMVTFLAFVRPALQRMMGLVPQAPLALRARSQESIRKKPGRTEYQRGVASLASDGQLQVRTTGNQGSGVLSSMAQANALIVLAHEQGSVQAGDLVEIWPLHDLA